MSHAIGTVGRVARRRIRAVAVVGALLAGMGAMPAAARGAPAKAAAPAEARTSTGAKACAASPVAGAEALPAGEIPSASKGVKLPADEAAHHDSNEWWYFSGHLLGVDAAGHEHCYGFEYVTFQFLGIAPAPVYIGNLSITDLTRRTFHYGAEKASYAVPTVRNRFALHTGTWTMRGGSGHDVLHASLPNYSLALNLQTTKPAVLHGHDGIIPFGPFGTSKYYSWTSLRTGGTVVDHGVKVKVQGLSWMDHQWGSFDFAAGGGWDWFSAQLSNGNQYMLYFIRNKAGKVVQTVATRVGAKGRTSHLASGSFGEKATGTWRSSVTGITYSSGWKVTLPGGDLTVTPDLRDQELDLRKIQGVAYWEGDVSIRGRIGGHAVSGVGYTEINPPGQP
jgi:predicted secreted hydrolase